jgi:hypothetical protein
LKPELVWVDQQPPPAEAGGPSCEYVQTFSPNISISAHQKPKLPADAYISRLARSTFCQRPTRFPPERCAFSPPKLLAEICASSKPVKPIASGAGCQPAEITGFPPDFNSPGSFHPAFDPWRGSLQRVRKRSPAQNGPENRPMPRRKTVKKLKIAWRFCSTRKPFRELCPRMRTPAKMGLSWRLTILDATSCCADAANSSDTQSLVLGQSFIPELPKARKRRIKKVTCSAQRRLLAVKRRSCDPDFHAA